MNSIEDYCDLLEFKYPAKSKSFYDGYKYAFKRLDYKGYINDIQTKSLNIKPSAMVKGFGDVSISTLIKNFQALIFILIEEKYSEPTINYFKEHFKTLCDRQNEEAEDQEMTDKQMENWIDYPDLFERFKQYYEYSVKGKDINYGLLRNITLVGLFVCIPPARLGNYNNMRFKFKKKLKGTSLQKCYNYLFIDWFDLQNEDGAWDFKFNEFLMIFNRYKTHRTLGQVVYDFEPSFAHFEYLKRPMYQEGAIIMCDLMKKYIKSRLRQRNVWVKTNRKKTNEQLFTTNNGGYLTIENLNYSLNSTSKYIFGKELSCNMFRHIFLTDYLQQNFDIESNRRVALLMGQTYNPTMMEKYVKKKPVGTKDKISVSFE